MSTRTISLLRLLTETLMNELDPDAPRSTRDACGEFVVRFYGNMQLLYRLAFTVLSAWLVLSSLLTRRKPFLKLTDEERSGMAERWRRSRLPIKKDFIRLIFTLVIISYYDDEATTNELNIERAAYLRNLSFYNGSASHE